MSSIVPFPRTAQTPRDLSFLAEVLRTTEPELFAPVLVDETSEERKARLTAAADIVDELATEFAAEGPADLFEGSAA